MITSLFSLALAADYTLVGLYDPVALLPPAEEVFTWLPRSGMTASCGSAKAPDGLGVMEAHAVASRLSPALAVVIKKNRTDAPTLDSRTVRVAVGTDRPLIRVQPSVLPRFLSVRLEGNASPRTLQLVRSQLEMELCLEHKTGRGWIGGIASDLREAFLLDLPDAAWSQGAAGPDRMYFRGQQKPVPALLGAPDACLQKAVGLAEPPAESGRGESSLKLVPSDVWGASLRWCNENEQANKPVGRPARLVMGQEQVDPRWEELVIRLIEQPEGTQLTVRYAEEDLKKDVSLFQQVPDARDNSAREALFDLLAALPWRYPQFGPAEEPDRYTVLLIPNWQLVEALRQVLPQTYPVQEIQDGVGWALAHPDQLFIQVSPGDVTEENWPNLASAGLLPAWADWGFTVGSISAREPVVLPDHAAPLPEQVADAHRVWPHALFLGGILTTMFFCFAGLRRIRDVWSAVPEERVDYWPGVGPEQGDGDRMAGADALIGLKDG